MGLDRRLPRPHQKNSEPYPLEVLLERYRSNDDEVLLMVLTHPHADHVAGFADLLEDLDPKQLAVTGVGTASAASRTLADEVDVCSQRESRGDTGRALLASSILTALRAINTWAEGHVGALIPINDGEQYCQTSAATIYARSPHSAILEAWFQDDTMSDIMATRANALS